ncbi:hypothetical protein [Nonomuraea sp. NPDC050643]|uniref:hypothetical protein n=1 Tax=Nonomuraea sp. NPDC050643 TaxID=3155660 RepID=UPI003400E0A1
MTMSLETKLVLSSIALLAVVSAVIATATTLLFNDFLTDRLDLQVGSAARRATSAAAQPPPEAREVAFLLFPGQSVDTFGARVRAPDGDQLVTGLPVTGVQATLTRLVVVEAAVTPAGVAVTAVACTLLVRRAVRPSAAWPPPRPGCRSRPSRPATPCAWPAYRRWTPTRAPGPWRAG